MTAFRIFFSNLRVLLFIIFNCHVQVILAQERDVNHPGSSFDVALPHESPVQVSPNLSSGTVNIQLPIGSHVAPVSLNYATTGLRVSDRGGVLGLGWNLSAGGSIVRMKQRIADDKKYGFCGQVATGGRINHTWGRGGTSDAWSFCQFAESHNRHNDRRMYDNEPDIYSYNFLGFSGMFTLDKDRRVINLTNNNLIIDLNFIDNFKFQFIITDPSGNKYHFEVEEFREIWSDGTGRNHNVAGLWNRMANYPEYFDKNAGYDILAENGNLNWRYYIDYDPSSLFKSASFHLDNSMLMDQSLAIDANTIRDRSDLSDIFNDYVHGNGHDGIMQYLIDKYRSKWHLSKVEMLDGTEVTFEYINGPVYVNINETRPEAYVWKPKAIYPNATKEEDRRWDQYTQDQYSSTRHSPKLLSRIKFNDSEIKFDYSSRSDHARLYKLDEITYKENIDNIINYNFYYRELSDRLMLSMVTKNDRENPIYRFVYNGDDNGSKMPAGVFKDTRKNRGFHTADAANTLKKLYYENGSYDEFEYDYHDFTKVFITDETLSYDQHVEGVRIKRIKKVSAKGESYSTSIFDYKNPQTNRSSGQLYNRAQYWHYHHWTEDAFLQKVYGDYPKNRINDFMGRSICYEYVKVTEIDGGSVQHQFHTFDDDLKHGTGVADTRLLNYHWDHPSINADPKYFAPVDGKLRIWDVDYTYNASDPDMQIGLPFGQRDFRGSIVGAPKNKWIKDHEDNVLMEENFEYDYRTVGNVSKGMHLDETAEWSGGKRVEYLATFYELQLGYPLLTKKTQKTYDPMYLDDPERAITTITDTDYHDDYPFPVKTETYVLGDEENKKTEKIKYAFELGSPYFPFTWVGFTNGILQNLPLPYIKTSYYRDKEIAKSVTTYNHPKLGAVPIKSETYSNGILVGEKSFEYDENYHYLRSSTDHVTNFSKTEIKDHYESKVLASVSNAKFDEVVYEDFEDNLYLSNYSYSEWVELWKDNMISDASTYFGKNVGDLSHGAYALNKIGTKPYIISYIKKDDSGTVNINGAFSDKRLLDSHPVLNGWTYYKYRINSLSSTMSIAGTGKIDELKYYPADAQMTTYTYHPMFGKTSETDNHGQTTYYEYDDLGRPTLVRDKHGDIISTQSHHIQQPVIFNVRLLGNNTSNPLRVSEFGEVREFYVESNSTGLWTVTAPHNVRVEIFSQNRGSSKVMVTFEDRYIPYRSPTADISFWLNSENIVRTFNFIPDYYDD